MPITGLVSAPSGTVSAAHVCSVAAESQRWPCRCRERHLQELGSQPLAAPLPPPKRQKIAAAAAAARAAKASPPAPRAVSAPIVAARPVQPAENSAAFSSEDSPNEDEGRPAPLVGTVRRRAVSDRHATGNGFSPQAADEGPRPDTRHNAELAAELAAELEPPTRPPEGDRQSDSCSGFAHYVGMRKFMRASTWHMAAGAPS